MTEEFDPENPPKNWPFPTDKKMLTRAEDLCKICADVEEKVPLGNLGEK
jgi:hypothetical protein